jgi:hypothetical protein
MQFTKYVTFAFAALAFSAAADADVVSLKNGESVEGSFLGATARQIRFDVNGDIRTFDVDRVRSIAFEDAGAPPNPVYNSGVADPGFRRDRNGYTAQDSPPPSLTMVPVDTRVTVRMIDAVNSRTAQLGQTFRASIDEPIYIDGREVIGRGADVVTKLVEDRQSGKFEGRTVLTLALVSITVNGRDVAVQSSDVKTESSSRGTRSAETVGGGTALGAIVGALAGGGKGAAIGAASGATLGAGVEVFTQGQVVKIPSETRLTFRLQTPIQL